MGTEETRHSGPALRLIGLGAALMGSYLALRYLAGRRLAAKEARERDEASAARQLPSSAQRSPKEPPQPGRPAAARDRPQTSTGGRSPEATEHAAVARRQQALIDQVGRDFAGQPFDAVLRGLRDAFVADGLALPTGPWFQAVATELAAGRHFSVGGATEQPPSRVGDRPVQAEHELWFQPDPAVEHIPPSTRTSSGKEDPRADTPPPEI